MNGTVKKKTDRGFGFIAVEGEKDVFFHSSALVDVSFEEIREGDKVEFDLADGDRGPSANNVKIVE